MASLPARSGNPGEAGRRAAGRRRSCCWTPPGGRDRIGSEWPEHRLERDPGHLAEDLLELARPTRARDRFEPLVGPVWYRRALGFALWQLQIALGRLVPVLSTLVKPTAG